MLIRKLFVCFICFALSTGILADMGVYTVTASSLKVRLQPSIDAKVIKSLRNKQRVTVYESVHGWARVSQYHDGKDLGEAGLVSEWVSMKYLLPIHHKIVNSKEVKSKITNEARDKLIDRQFTVWSGSHRNLESLIENNLKDPDSYEHIETSYFDIGDYLIVQTRYRARNGFGGMTMGFVKAKVSLNGRILEIIEQR